MSNKACIILYVLINALFVDKYGARITDWHIVISAAYCLLAGIGTLYLPKIAQKTNHRYALIICGGLYLAMGIGLQYAIDPMSLQVDRWSAIHHFLDGMLSGIYPYGQQTHLGGYGSPLPVWQVLHLPFYAIGNVGLSIFAAIAAFIYTLHRTRGEKVAWTALLLLVASPACWYEITVRSDLITNIILAATIAEWLVYKGVRLKEHYIGIGILCGLLVSTRLIAIIPLAVAYGYEFIQLQWRKQLGFVGVMICTFALTILPFVFWKGSTLLFFEYNPFVLQTRQGSLLALILFAVVAVSTTLYYKSSEQVRLPLTGWLLTSLVVIAFVEKMWRENIWTELYSSAFDITYLSVALPFYIVCLATSCGESDS